MESLLYLFCYIKYATGVVGVLPPPYSSRKKEEKLVSFMYKLIWTHGMNFLFFLRWGHDNLHSLTIAIRPKSCWKGPGSYS